MLLESLTAITPQAQKKAARSNNREFMHKILKKIADKNRDFEELEVSAEDVVSSEGAVDSNHSDELEVSAENAVANEGSLDSVDEEIKLMERAAEKEVTEQQVSTNM